MDLFHYLPHTDAGFHGEWYIPASITPHCVPATLNKPSLRFTTNDLIRHQQVVTEAETGKRRAFDFLTAAERRGGGCTSCRQWLFIPPSDLRTNTHSLHKKKEKHKHKHTRAHKYTHTHRETRALVFPLASWTTTGSLRECVAMPRAFFVCLLSKSKQKYHDIIITIKRHSSRRDEALIGSLRYVGGLQQNRGQEDTLFQKSL